MVIQTTNTITFSILYQFNCIVLPYRYRTTWVSYETLVLYISSAFWFRFTNPFTHLFHSELENHNLSSRTLTGKDPLRTSADESPKSSEQASSPPGDWCATSAAIGPAVWLTSWPNSKAKPVFARGSWLDSGGGDVIDSSSAQQGTISLCQCPRSWRAESSVFPLNAASSRAS